MVEADKNQNGGKKIGGDDYRNNDCWLVKNLGYAPYRRCQYCEFKFRRCLFLQYQVISLFLIALAFILFILIEKRLSWLVVITVFILVIVYGYFFNRSTERIIKANFSLKRATDALKELTDNLESKVAEQTSRISDKNKHLEELLGMKSDFLRVVNHQLNTPLSVMRSAYSMLQEKTLPPKQALIYLGSGLEAMSNTIQDFWDAFELEGQEMQANFAVVDIERIINDQVDTKRLLKITQERKIKLVYQKPSFEVPKVFCDPKKIVHVISNLLDNAIFYTPAGSVTVSLGKVKQNTSEYLKVFVTDTGAGISLDDQKRMFRKFSRGDSANNLHPDGSGLGLYIAQKVVGGCGGKLELEKTEIGKGTTFSFILPISTGQAETKEKVLAAQFKVGVRNSKNTVAKAKQRPSILLIEDQQLLVEMYDSYLRSHGFNFYSVSDVKTALAKLREVSVDVVLLDIILPQKREDGSVYTVAEQGWSFLEAAKKDPAISKIPVIIFTNLNTDQDREKAKKLGAAAYVFKGNTEPKDLIKVINNSLENIQPLS
ncbi:MAG: hybrid sensor histidine kinase/response regulator [Patescibacteria group bacterium]